MTERRRDDSGDKRRQWVDDVERGGGDRWKSDDREEKGRLCVYDGGKRK
jgi:hypothetical protein